ncbi:asparagine synthase-related protein [Geomicrobium sp. JCM 19055]|uniref:asparagine synthase-related protein n=1 Tax=Geomicrobium sp. JCM 19055 TaxID=1460649 RepID=UPI0009DCA2B3|nr:asparagine synthase C-terminal domain-containing protein [Geomicrobium sp. JCM 19055]
MAKENVTVVLSGEGADELFAGYRIYQEPEALKAIASLPRMLKRPLRQVLSKLPAMYGINYVQRACTPLNERFVGNAKVFQGDKSSVLNKRLINYDVYEELSNVYEEASNWNDVQKMQHIDMNFWLPGDILVKGDRMSMANSLELRVPFFRQGSV